MRGFRYVAIVLVLSGCAMVTGLGDYEVFDSSDSVDASTDTSVPDNTTADAFVPPTTGKDASENDAEPVTSTEGGVDAGVDSSVDASVVAYAPSCARTSCADFLSSGFCKDQPCNVVDKWPVTKTLAGDLTAQSGQCNAKTTTGDSTAFITETLPAGSRYDFEVRFLLKASTGDDQTSIPIVRIVSGGTTITVETSKRDSLRLCVNGNCSANASINAGGGTVIDVYGLWGDTVTNSYVSLRTGAPSDCTERTERALNPAAAGTLTASVGCLNKNCDLTFDEVSFLQHPF